MQLTLEAVGLLLTGKKQEWAILRKLIMEATFIPSIVNFDRFPLYRNFIYPVAPKFPRKLELTLKTIISPMLSSTLRL